MPAIVYTSFGGLVPRLEATKLPELAAQVAENVDLRRGALTPMAGPAADSRADAAAPTIPLPAVIACGAAGETDPDEWAALAATGVLQLSLKFGATVETVDLNPDLTDVTSMDDVASVLAAALQGWSGVTYDLATAEVAWDDDAHAFTLRIPADEVMAPTATLEVGEADLLGSGWCNWGTRDEYQENLETETIALWRYQKGGFTAGGVTFGIVGTTDLHDWGALEATGGFTIRINNQDYHIRPVITGRLRRSGEEGTGAAYWPNISNAMTYALVSKTGNPYHRLYYDATATKFVLDLCGLEAQSITAPSDTDLVDLSSAAWMNVTNTEATEVALESGEEWMRWGSLVHAVRTPIADDFYHRLYYTGDGVPKMRLTLNGSSVTRPLRIPAPESPPTVTGEAVDWPEDPDAEGRRPAHTWMHPVKGGAAVTLGGKEKRLWIRSYVQEWYNYDVVQLETTTVFMQGRASKLADAETDVCVQLGGNAPAVLSPDNGMSVTWGEWTATAEKSHSFSVELEQVDSRTIKVTISGNILVKYTQAGELEEELEEDDEPITVSYCYSLVTDIGEEGPLSPASPTVTVKGTYSVELTDFEIPTATEIAARGLVKIRVYRAADGEFRWHGDTALTTTTYVDATPAEDDLLGEIAPTYLHNPPDDLQGLIACGNGWFAGFRGKEVCCCEPYVPYAWPEAYRFVVQDDVVGLAYSGNDLLVMTTGRPKLLVGAHPSELTEASLEGDQACISAAGIAQVGRVIVYPGPDGLVGYYAGVARVLTRKLLRQEDWEAMAPSSMVGAAHDGRYIATLGAGLLIFDLDSDAGLMVTSDVEANALLSDVETDSLYLADGDAILVWQGSADALTADWQGRDWLFARPVSFSVLRVRCSTTTAPGDEEPDLRALVTLYADGSSVYSGRVTTGTAVKLPVLAPARRWSVRVQSASEVQQLELVTSTALLEGA